MRIGIYNPRVGTKAAGGTETFLRQIMKRCEEDIVLFTGSGELLDEIADLNVDVHQIPVRYKEDWLNRVITDHSPVLPAEIESVSMFSNAVRTGAVDRMSECDVLSTHYYADNLLVSRFVDVPQVFRFAGIKEPSPRWKTMLTIADPDSYVANSASTANRLSRWYGLEVDGIVYAGVDVKQFSPAREGDGGNRGDDGGFVVLFVGRLDDGKGVPDLIEAVQGMEVFLRIVGDGNRRSDFEGIAREKLPEDQYKFTGTVPHEEVHEEFQAADLFCLPSYHESFGIVVVEALACGVPVVTTKIDAIEEYIHHGENGLLFEPRDVKRLRELIGEVEASETVRRRLAENGRETALDYSWETQIEKMTRIYRRVSE